MEFLGSLPVSKFITKTFYVVKFWDMMPGSYFIPVHKKSKLVYIEWFWIHMYCYVVTLRHHFSKFYNIFFCHEVRNWKAHQKLHFSLNKVALIFSGSGLKFKITLVLRFATPLFIYCPWFSRNNSISGATSLKALRKESLRINQQFEKFGSKCEKI